MPPATKTKRAPKLTAKTADKHTLYELAVQNVEAEIDFVDDTYKTIRGKAARTLREDFCGTGNTSCEWVRRRKTNTAVGLDIDKPTLAWGKAKNVAKLPAEARSRVQLLARDVLTPGDATGTDLVLAMNFSYWLFRKRRELLDYYKSVFESLPEHGVFMLDHYGGWESMKEVVEDREVQTPDGQTFTYVWEQARYAPVTGDMDCRISFRFEDGTEMTDAFSYTWRLWTLPEVRDLLYDAGFERVTVYWEGAEEIDEDEHDDDEDIEVGGNGIFEPTEDGEADPAFISYIVAEKRAMPPQGAKPKGSKGTKSKSRK